MSDGSKIEWTDATWNPVTGCSVVSPGCKHCYAMKLAGTRLAHHLSRAGLTVETAAGPVWNGQVRFNEISLDQPLWWKRPRRIFVCAHGDLFHENVPDEWIDRLFAVMALCPQHTFQVLTKRAKRMRDYFASRPAAQHLEAWAWANPPGSLPVTMHEAQAWLLPGATEEQRHLYHAQLPAWPLPNVWLGVSAEDQERANERIPELLEMPAAVRFVSLEPLLSAIDLTRLNPQALFPLNALRAWADSLSPYADPEPCPRIDWVIVGGESGPKARPMHPDWARSLRDQCQAASVPFFFKQWGEWHPCEMHGNGVCYAMPGHAPFDSWRAVIFNPDATEGWNWRRLGKKRAGRLLDGVEHNAYPEARHG